MVLLEMSLTFGSQSPSKGARENIEDKQMEKGWALAETSTIHSEYAEEGDYPCVTTMTFIKSN